ncbi:hypothetical protein BN2475_520028 [Paraburkholderia ribeironis]|uniref:Uncharacterized protein n=1 Tax=Paraburkholderia ribeironis TaxID=1247936 RepID=A0A1N7SCG3_9BURK|nr:hypothetical protein BN2475_520028 [Paraburkholderia ribeironis]
MLPLAVEKSVVGCRPLNQRLTTLRQRMMGGTVGYASPWDVKIHTVGTTTFESSSSAEPNSRKRMQTLFKVWQATVLMPRSEGGL